MDQKRKDYLSWDEYFIGLAALTAMRSKDPNTQVGACIVSNDNRVLSVGYNGAPNGFSDELMPWGVREAENHYDTKYPYICHSELNAILNFRGNMRELAGEISDCRLFPIVDNDIPGLSADRLEYTLSNGYFTYETWTLDQVKRFIDDITILKNENDIDELGFRDLATCKEFVLGSLTLFEEYRSDNCRTIMQFIADIIKSMELRDYLTLDDLYTMSEREVVDWILSCGDKTLTEAFRQLQRATCVYSSNTIKKDRYCVSVKTKTRYIVPLVQGDSEVGPSRIVDLSRHTARAIKKYLDAKSSKYVGFDFEFTPYSE